MMFPLSDLTISLIELIANPEDEAALDNAWDGWAFAHRNSHPGTKDADGFIALVSTICERTVIVCHNYATFGFGCDNCGDTFHANDLYDIDGDLWCETCRNDNLIYCDRCNEWSSRDEAHCLHGYTYCDHCVQNYFSYCEDCEEYYDPDYDPDYTSHDHGCNCEAPNLNFTFPANGKGRVSNDERLTLELPKGTIDEVGMDLIHALIYNEGQISYDITTKMLEEVGPLWQAKRGNFTRRVSSAYYKLTKQKLPDGVISKIGNLARAHSDESSQWHIEFTRDLNLSAEAFYHDDSCWWQSYYASRCALKSWGGIGLRSFADDISNRGVTGRAWVQPLYENLKPTHDTMGAHAYIVYNGYGDLDGYKAARIVAHLTSKTYRKVEFFATPQYVNSGVGYLVADEATCASTDQIGWDDHDAHNILDASDHHHMTTGAAA